MRKIRSIIIVTLLAAVSALVALINPIAVLATWMSVFAFLAIARQMNLYRIVLLMKNYTKKVASIRCEIHARIHTGFRDYNESIDEKSHARSSGLVR